MEVRYFDRFSLEAIARNTISKYKHRLTMYNKPYNVAE